jgi:tRNA:m4X modification enzyme
MSTHYTSLNLDTNYLMSILEVSNLSRKPTPTPTSYKQKDNDQVERLLSLLNKYHLLNQSSVYIEFGAGKGHLSHSIAVANQDLSGHVLLERESRRHKYDRFHRDNPHYKRLMTDISDFQIDKVHLILSREDKGKVIGVSKHICGMASDLSISTLTNY